MATRGSRDVKMTLSVETLGQDEILALKKAVEQLAAEGGEAAPEFQALADQIGRLGAQNEAVSNVKRLGEETENLRDTQVQTAASLEQMQAKLVELKATTDAARESQQRTADALLEWRKNGTDAAAALTTLVKTTDAAGKKTQEYKDNVSRLVAEQAEAKKRVAELSAEMQQSNKAVTEAERAQKKLETAIGTASKKVEEQTKRVSESERALKEAGVAAESLGISTDNLAQAEGELLVALKSVASEAERTKAEVELLAAAEKQLAEGRAFEQQLEDARALSEAIKYVQWWKDALEEAEAQKRKMSEGDAAARWQKEAEAIVEAAEAQQRLNRAQEIAIAVQRELAAQDAFERQAEANRKMQEAAEYTRWWTDALKAADAQAEETATAAKAAGDAINNAFNTIGVRSAESLRQEIEQVRAAMKHLEASGTATGSELRGAFSAGNARIRELERDIRKLTGSLTFADKAASAFKNSMGQIAVGNLIADAIASIIERVKEMGRQFVAVIASTERLRRSLNAIYKDGEVAAKQFQVLKDVSNEAGVSFNALRDSFVRFSASAKSAGIQTEVANELFRNLTVASASLGLSSESTAGALDALGQMAAKGVVTMEELRQQLGDRLPGAIGLAAKGLGLTEQELVKLVETGQLATQDFFPAFAQALKGLHGDTNTLSAAWARFTNLLTGAAQSAGDAGWLKLLKEGLRLLGSTIGGVLVVLNGFTEAVSLGAKAVMAFYETLKGNGREAWAAFNEEVLKSGQRLSEQIEKLNEYQSGQIKATSATNSAAQAVAGNTTQVLQNAAAQEQVAASVTNSGNAYVQALSKMAQNTKAAEANTAAAEKLAKAKELEGRAATEAARLSGNAAAELQASASAAQANVEASQRVIAARQNEVGLTQQAIDVIKAEGAQRGGLTGAMQLQIKALEDTLVKQQAEVEKSVQATEQLKAQAAAAEVLAAVYKDNSANLETYRQRMENLQRTAASMERVIKMQEKGVEMLSAALADGKITTEQYNAQVRILEEMQRKYSATVRDAAKAEALYRDAVEDSARSLKMAADSKAADLQISRALASVQQGHLEGLSREAAARGDATMATQYAIQAKEKEIEQMRLSAQIREIELQAERAGVEAERERLRSTGELTKEKEKELELRLKLIEVREIENGKTAEGIKLLQQEIKTLRERNAMPPPPSPTGNTSAPGGSGGSGTSGGSGGSQNKSPAELERERKLAGQNAVDNSLMFRLRDKLQAGLLTADDLPELMAVLESNKVNRQIADSMGPGAWSLQGRNDWNAWQNTMQQFQQFADAQTAPKSKDSSTNKTVTINVGGRSQKIAVGSDADAQNLTSILRQLENQANTAS